MFSKVVDVPENIILGPSGIKALRQELQDVVSDYNLISMSESLGPENNLDNAYRAPASLRISRATREKAARLYSRRETLQGKVLHPVSKESC